MEVNENFFKIERDYDIERQKNGDHEAYASEMKKICTIKSWANIGNGKKCRS